MMIEKIQRYLLKLPDDGKGLYFLLGLSAVLKLTLAAALFHTAFNPDGVRYILAAQQVAMGNFKEAFALHPLPLYPILVAAVHFIIPHWVVAAQFLSISASLLMLIPLYLMTRDLFHARAAFWGCLAFALAPAPNGWALEALRGPCYVLFFAWAVWFALRSIGLKKWGGFVWAVVLSWLSVLLRIEGLIIVLFLPLYLAILSIRRTGERRVYLKGVAVCLAIPALLSIVCGFVMGSELLNADTWTAVNPVLSKLMRFDFIDNYISVNAKLKAFQGTFKQPGGDLVEITRHYMTVVYLIGFMETFLRVLFPFFIIPLVWGMRGAWSARRLFLSTMVFFYLLVNYYLLVERDFMAKRFLFAAVFLCFPWVGAGMDRMVTFFRESSKSKFLILCFTVVFIVFPVGKTALRVLKQDTVVYSTAEWLLEKPALRNAFMVTTDLRIPFYAGKKSDEYYMIYETKNDYKMIEKEALGRQADLLIIRRSISQRGRIPELSGYIKIKAFYGRKDMAVIYCSPKLRKLIDRADDA